MKVLINTYSFYDKVADLTPAELDLLSNVLSRCRAYTTNGSGQYVVDEQDQLSYRLEIANPALFVKKDYKESAE